MVHQFTIRKHRNSPIIITRKGHFRIPTIQNKLPMTHHDLHHHSTHPHFYHPKLSMDQQPEHIPSNDNSTHFDAHHTNGVTTLLQLEIYSRICDIDIIFNMLVTCTIEDAKAIRLRCLRIAELTAQCPLPLPSQGQSTLPAVWSNTQQAIARYNSHSGTYIDDSEVSQ